MAPQIHRLKIVKSTLSVHSTNAVQTTAVTTISYKPLCPSPFDAFGVYRPLVTHKASPPKLIMYSATWCNSADLSHSMNLNPESLSYDFDYQ